MRTVYEYVCPICTKVFSSLVRGRKFCSLKCLGQSNSINAKLNPAPPIGDTVKCLECGQEFHRKPYQIKRGKRFCSKPCYRSYMAKRFDREAAFPVTFRQMQNFDEYLSQDKLECLVEGCSWVGDNLSDHMNFTHGIRAKDFKHRVGFNQTTAIISAPMAKKLKGVERKGRDLSAVQEYGVDKAAKDRKPMSKEALEHFIKAGIMRRR